MVQLCFVAGEHLVNWLNWQLAAGGGDEAILQGGSAHIISIITLNINPIITIIVTPIMTISIAF